MGFGYVKLVLAADPDFEPAMAWAFGRGWKTVVLSSLMDQWNERHGEIFVIRGSDPVDESFERIMETYKKLRTFDVQLDLDVRSELSDTGDEIV